MFCSPPVTKWCWSCKVKRKWKERSQEGEGFQSHCTCDSWRCVAALCYGVGDCCLVDIWQWKPGPQSSAWLWTSWRWRFQHDDAGVITDSSAALVKNEQFIEIGTLWSVLTLTKNILGLITRCILRVETEGVFHYRHH